MLPVPSAPEVTIAALGPGDRLAGVFACVRKDRLAGRSGPYLAVDLRDRTGTMPARIFKDVDRWEGNFDRGDVVQVSGSVDRYRDELVAELTAVRRVDPASVDPARFLPVAYRDLDELDGFLEGLAGEIGDPGFGGLLRELLADEALRRAWRLAPCSIGAITPTSVGCSSTRWRSGRWRSRPASTTPASTATCC